MIHFNELYVTEDNKRLVIDVEIDDIDGYSSCYLDSITVTRGEDCGKNDKLVATVFERKGGPIGDLDGDSRITAYDAELWKLMLAACGLTTGIKYDDGCNKYYVPDFIDLNGNVYEKRYLSDSEYAIYNDIRQCVSDSAFSGVGYLGKLLTYILIALGDERDSIFPNASTDIPGDLNGNDVVDIEDINVFIDFILRQAGVIPSTTEVVYEDRTHVRLCLSASDLSPLFTGNTITNSLLIVAATAGCGNAEEVAKMGCGYDESTITGVAYNGKPLYDTAVKYANSYGNSCSSNDMSAFLDWLMRYYGFLFALKSGDLCQAQYYWANYLNDSASSVIRSSNNCGCHGTYR